MTNGLIKTRPAGSFLTTRTASYDYGLDGYAYNVDRVEGDKVYLWTVNAWNKHFEEVVSLDHFVKNAKELKS